MYSVVKVKPNSQPQGPRAALVYLYLCGAMHRRAWILLLSSLVGAAVVHLAPHMSNEAYWSVGSRNLGAEAAAIAASLGLKPGMTVCEMGPGDGTLLAKLYASVSPHGKLVAASPVEDELVRTACTAAHAKVQGELTTHLSSEEHWAPGLPNGTCDAIYVRFVVHILPNAALARYMVQWAQALSPGGRLLVVSLNESRTSLGSALTTVSTQDAQVAQMTASGFALIGIPSSHPFPYVDGCYQALYTPWSPLLLHRIAPSSTHIWRDIAPSWDALGAQVNTYHDDDLLDVVNRAFPHLTEKVKNFRTLIERTDIARLALMHLYGGIYADMDQFLLSPSTMHSMLRSGQAYLPLEKDTLIGQSILISPPRHPLWEALALAMVNNYDARCYETMNTGPDAVTNLWNGFCSKKALVLNRVRLHNGLTTGPVTWHMMTGYFTWKKQNNKKSSERKLGLKGCPFVKSAITCCTTSAQAPDLRSCAISKYGGGCSPNVNLTLTVGTVIETPSLRNGVLQRRHRERDACRNAAIHSRHTCMLNYIGDMLAVYPNSCSASSWARQKLRHTAAAAQCTNGTQVLCDQWCKAEIKPIRRSARRGPRMITLQGKVLENDQPYNYSTQGGTRYVHGANVPTGDLFWGVVGRKRVCGIQNASSILGEQCQWDAFLSVILVLRSTNSSYGGALSFRSIGLFRIDDRAVRAFSAQSFMHVDSIISFESPLQPYSCSHDTGMEDRVAEVTYQMDDQTSYRATLFGVPRTLLTAYAGYSRRGRELRLMRRIKH